MSAFWENEIIYIAANFSVVILCLVLFLAIFELVTKYKNWEEIKKGNMAVAMATGGKYLVLQIFSVTRLTITIHC